MAIARGDHTATLLTDGRVLVAGGLISSLVLSSAEIYDAATGTWTATGPMAVARAGHTAMLLGDGRVLVAAGFNATPLASAEIFDPVGTWSNTASMTEARHNPGAALLADGRVLAVGGCSSQSCTGVPGVLSSAEIYDAK